MNPIVSGHRARAFFAFIAGRGLALVALLAALALGMAWAWADSPSGVGGSDVPAAPPAKATADTSANGAVTTTAATDAAVAGQWTVVRNSMARGGAYMSAGSKGVGTSLEFPIEVDRPTEIAVTPIWFANGDQRKACRFPGTAPFFNVQQAWPMRAEVWEYPKPSIFPAAVVSKPGPDAIVVFEGKAFFTAPASGKVGVVDLKTERVAGAIDVGGYVADLVVNKEKAELLVADAGNNRIVVLDARDGKQLAQVPVPALPWSIALHKGNLYVASMAARKVAVVDVAGRKVSRTIDLPLGPQNVAIVGDKQPQLIVRLLPMVFDMKTFQEVPADRLTYWPSLNYGPPLEKPEVEAIAKAAAAFPKAAIKVFFSSKRDSGASILDVGPMHARCRSGYPSKPDVTKVYVVEPGFKGVTVFPVDGAKAQQIALDETPSAMELCDLRLYVLCKETRKVFEIDALEDKVIRTLSLPHQAAEFYAGYLVPKHTTVEQFDAGEVIDGYLPGRIALGFAPLAYDPEKMSPAEAPALPFFPGERRSQALSSGPRPRQLSVDNLHTIRVEDKPADKPSDKPSASPVGRWIDTSSVTDYHVSGNPALLMPGDAPGAVTLSVDDGPECDWENDVWFTPDQRALLARGTDEFDLWNAVRFTLKPGKHVLKVKACGPQANLEAIRITRTLAGSVDARLEPLPRDVHGKVPLPSYGGVFPAGEPVSFKMKLTNKCDGPLKLEGNWTVLDYEDKTVLDGKVACSLGAGATDAQALNLDLKQGGRYVIRLKLSSPDGEHEVFHRFVKLPKLEYPRLLYRAEETGQIKARVARYPLLYQRYRDWLRRENNKPGFLPKTMRGGTGEGMPVENKKWRAIAMQFADMFLEPAGAKRYEKTLVPYLTWDGGYDAWQGDYEFGGAHTILNDLMMVTSDAARKNLETMYRSPEGNGYISDTLVQGSVFPDYLLMVREPLTPRDRAVLYNVAIELNNYDRYLAAHAGRRGGNWWHGTTTWCHCAITSVTRTFLWCRNFFGEKNFFERTNISGMLTLQAYAYPRYDTQNYMLFGSVRESTDKVNNTAAMRWALSGLSRKPLEKTYYKEVYDCIDKLGAPMADEARELDELLAKGSNAVIPLFLALGWLDPELKAVQWEEMPPSMLFEGEGAACMKSGWDRNMTDIYFVSGVKDTSYRVLPNHFTLFKAGRMVVGTAQLGDHGEPVPFDGNCVRVGEEDGFADYLRRGGAYNRMEERFVTNVFAAMGYTYLFRDWRMSTYRQEGTYWAGGGHEPAYPRGVTLHSHSAHPFCREGGILAYETFPAFDYVAGNATNSWPLADVKEAYRQLLYVRPDVLVIYDRVLLGDGPGDVRGAPGLTPSGPDKGASANAFKSVKWPLRVMENKANEGVGGRGLKLNGEVFTGTDNVASVWGRAFLPKDGAISVSRGYIEIKPSARRKQVEFLVALRVGLAQPAPLDCSLVEEIGQAGIAFAYQGRNYTVLFSREGGVSGRIRVEKDGKAVVDRALAQEVRDTYENWKGTPLFDKWMREDRFKAYVTEADRKRFGEGAK